MELRTDLAVEQREIAGEDIRGVDYSVDENGALRVERMKVSTERAAQLLKKPVGNYVTIELPPLTDNVEGTDERLIAIADEIRKLIPVHGLVLVAGLGNTEITPDALGPKTVDAVLATRHITGEIARATGLDRLRPVAVISAGVTGKTGIETGEHLLGVIARIKPSAMIVIDALASRRLSRLGCTLQISNAGISPGAGVGNHRARIDEKTMGVPVIAVGVPTVVDAFTLATDLLKINDEAESRRVLEEISPEGRTMVITPKEIDLLIERAARLISLSVNYALHPDVEMSDLLALL